MRSSPVDNNYKEAVWIGNKPLVVYSAPVNELFLQAYDQLLSDRIAAGISIGYEAHCWD